MKKSLFPLLVLGLFIFLLLSYLSIIDLSKSNNEALKIEPQKNEYIYKEELLNLGYNINEITTIENKINIQNVKNYLLNKKYDNLIKLLSSPYFKIENIERYENYYKNNPNYSLDEITLYVQIGLDKEYYTDIKEINDYYETTALVNKYNKLPQEINYDDLVQINKPYSNDGTKKLRSVAFEPLKEMIDEAKKDGIKLFVVSGYRTMKQQNYLFNNSVKKNGIDHALVYSAKKGHSEHQLGLAVDLNTTQNSFEKTKQYKWLKQNSYKYGFIERYPKGKEFITGYAFEPWHYRYLGVDIATKIFEENITYEEYLVKYDNESF